MITLRTQVIRRIERLSIREESKEAFKKFCMWNSWLLSNRCYWLWYTWRGWVAYQACKFQPANTASSVTITNTSPFQEFVLYWIYWFPIQERKGYDRQTSPSLRSQGAYFWQFGNVGFFQAHFFIPLIQPIDHITAEPASPGARQWWLTYRQEAYLQLPQFKASNLTIVHPSPPSRVRGSRILWPREFIVSDIDGNVWFGLDGRLS